MKTDLTRPLSAILLVFAKIVDATESIVPTPEPTPKAPDTANLLASYMFPLACLLSILGLMATVFCFRKNQERVALEALPAQHFDNIETAYAPLEAVALEASPAQSLANTATPYVPLGAGERMPQAPAYIIPEAQVTYPSIRNK